MFKTNFIKAGVAVFAVAGIAAMGMSNAQADPVGTPTAPRDYQGVGSDTIQDVWNDLANNPGFDGVNPGAVNAYSISSWDATGTSFITPISTKFQRPVGSGNGVKALSAAWSGGTCTWPVDNSGVVTNQALTNADVSFARSSSGPSASGSPDLTYVPFARDAVSVAYTPGPGETSVTFSRAELRAIYGGPSQNSTGTITYDTGAGTGNTGLPIKGGNILHPYLPQAGSGTLSFFLGGGGAGVSPVAGYVLQSSAYIENRGGVISGTTRALIPFSAAQWIYQQHKGGATDTTGGLLMASIDQDNNTGTAARTAVVGSGGSAAPGTLYGSLTAPPTGSDPFARDTYNVIPSSELAEDIYPYLMEAAGVGNTDAQDTIEGDGFGVLQYVDDPTGHPYPTSPFVCL